jgi:CHASE3 domain sensor protein
MENLIFTKQQIEEVLNIINTLPIQGFDSASKIVKIFQIMQSFKKEEIKQQINTEKIKEEPTKIL